ncbi:hypothetical protein LGR64_07080 [Delftia sp. Lp-1]|uniref:hypothetical protein n=1 Tax=Delftia sp. Lp-1 TaxID=682863 RepID=UPI001E2C2E36|nr:hypothetical protein [Delftia sp. Lp-1]MCB4786030.1 hypothetical protein [Delftia sp. Lp-1]
MVDVKAIQSAADAEITPFVEFLESIPPGSELNVSDLGKPLKNIAGQHVGYRFSAPDIQLHCSHNSCNGNRFFRCTNGEINMDSAEPRLAYVRYVCSNCRDVEKIFSIRIVLNRNSTAGKAYKFGEIPNFGPSVPSRLMKLVGPERDLFLKGRRCENQGLGVGAFVYYRRVVESQKNRILDEIIKVSRKLNSPEPAIEKLEAAKKESRFTQALKDVKDAVPQALLINGVNPLLLLHSALSDGLHERTDEHCLEVATSVRVVLAELAERLSQALKDEVELTRAIARLMSPASNSDSAS